MARPCTCEQCDRSGPFGPGQCRLCWLYHNRPAYRALWDGMAPSNEMVSRHAPCRHRGAEQREERCPNCRGFVRVKVFACALHGTCTVARSLDGIVCCVTCSDYAPKAPPMPAPEGNNL
jgi:hypothetical protein